MIRLATPVVEVTSDDDITRELERMRQKVRVRAYDLFQHRGPRDPAFDDWLQAERDLLLQPPVRILRDAEGYRIELYPGPVAPAEVKVSVARGRILFQAAAPESPAGEGRVLVDEVAGRRLWREIATPVDAEIDEATVSVEGSALVLRLGRVGVPRVPAPVDDAGVAAIRSAPDREIARAAADVSATERRAQAKAPASTPRAAGEAAIGGAAGPAPRPAVAGVRSSPLSPTKAAGSTTNAPAKAPPAPPTPSRVHSGPPPDPTPRRTSAPPAPAAAARTGFWQWMARLFGRRR